MTTDVAGAYGALRARLEANKPAALSFLRWQNEDGDPLPDTPAPFAYSEMVTDRSDLAGFGGGRGQNVYRNPGRFDCYIFVPRGQGLADALIWAEQVAQLYRSYRDDKVSCFDATVYPGANGADLKPPGLSSAVDNYFCVIVEVSVFFDQLG